MTAIRPIVKAAFKVNELVYQFTEIDVPDAARFEHGKTELHRENAIALGQHPDIVACWPQLHALQARSVHCKL